MSSLMIWYKLTIAGLGPLGLLPLRISNDVFSGDYVLDCDITVTMTPGATADTFDVKIYNLTDAVSAQIKAKHSEALSKKQPLQLTIYLDYFENLPQFTSQPTLTGVIMRLTNTVDASGTNLLRLEGQEVGGYQLRTGCVLQGVTGASTGNDFVQAIATQSGVSIAEGPGLTLPLTNFTLRAGNGLTALNQIADAANVPVIVRDNGIYIGPTVGSDPAPVAFDDDTNIVAKDDVQENDESPDALADPTSRKTTSMPKTSVNITVLGHGGLRVGQQVTLNTDVKPSGALRLNYVQHLFSSKSGYTCRTTVVAANPGEVPKRRLDGATGIVNRVSDMAERALDKRMPVDIGEVTAYNADSQSRHTATLNYGQTPTSDVVAPSLETTVDTDSQLNNKPIMSAFAFNQCGLIVPVYPKMRAVLLHNRGLTNDAIVSGFLWPDNPAQQPPPNQPGDYWLCLPTGLDGSGMPTGPSANDLTDKDGNRVVQVKGLHLMVGTSLLPNVGTRPPAATADQIVIEHKSGTKITIDANGGITIATSNQPISLSNGSVTLKVDGTAVAIS